MGPLQVHCVFLTAEPLLGLPLSFLRQELIKNGKPPQEGLGAVNHLAGLFGQRLYFWGKTQKYTDKLKINSLKCIGCGLCERLCPMGNIAVKNGIAVSSDKCTMCYRCISKCPEQVITLLGKKVIEQNDVSRYL